MGRSLSSLSPFLLIPDSPHPPSCSTHLLLSFPPSFLCVVLFPASPDLPIVSSLFLFSPSPPLGVFPSPLLRVSLFPCLPISDSPHSPISPFPHFHLGGVDSTGGIC